LMVTAQLRHVLLAKWSDKPSIKDQDHMFFILELGEGDCIPRDILEGEIGCRFVDFD
jgi:hypothetical protein